MFDAAYEYIQLTGDRSTWATMRAIIDREWSPEFSILQNLRHGFANPELFPVIIVFHLRHANRGLQYCSIRHAIDCCRQHQNVSQPSRAMAWLQVLVNGVETQMPVRHLAENKLIYMSFFADLLPTDTQVIIETGSGWGRNVFHLVSNALLTQHLNARVYGLEYSEGGRSVCRLLTYERKDAAKWPVKLFCGTFTVIGAVGCLPAPHFLPHGAEGRTQ